VKLQGKSTIENKTMWLPDSKTHQAF